MKQRWLCVVALLLLVLPVLASCRPGTAPASTAGAAAPVSPGSPASPAAPAGELSPSGSQRLPSTPTESSGRETASAGAAATQPAPVKANLAPAITTISLPAASIGVYYAQLVVASGGSTPYTWSLSGSSLPAGFSLDTSTGVIAGMPAAGGTFSFTARVTDSAGAAATKSLSITVAPFVTVGAVPDGDIGIPYSHFLVVSEGNVPDAWLLTGGSLPAGLSLDASTGEISGVPTAVGTFTFTVQMTARAVSATVSITIDPVPAITTTSLPDGKVGRFYLESLAVSGGAAPYTWSLLTGSVPDGLSFETSGLLIDIPTSTGTFGFTVQVTDSAGATAIRAVSITIGPAPAITTTSLPDGYVSALYSQSLVASGGIPPFTWSLAVGSLPGGLSFDTSAGMITGTPTTAGTSSFVVQLTDSGGATATQPLSITINQFVASASLPAGDVGVPYSQALAASGAVHYTWSLAGGSLPEGLSLDTSGSITGTPTAAGTSTFTLQVSGVTAEALSVTLSITINPAPVIITTSLAAGETGVPYSQTLVASGGTVPYAWVLEGILPFGLSINRSTGVITGTPSIAGTSTFAVQLSDIAGAAVRQVLSITIQ